MASSHYCVFFLVTEPRLMNNQHRECSQDTHLQEQDWRSGSTEHLSGLDLGVLVLANGHVMLINYELWWHHNSSNQHCGLWCGANWAPVSGAQVTAALHCMTVMTYENCAFMPNRLSTLIRLQRKLHSCLNSQAQVSMRARVHDSSKKLLFLKTKQKI